MKLIGVKRLFPGHRAQGFEPEDYRALLLLPTGWAKVDGASGDEVLDSQVLGVYNMELSLMRRGVDISLNGPKCYISHLSLEPCSWVQPQCWAHRDTTRIVSLAIRQPI